MSFLGDILFLDLGTFCNNNCYFCVVKGKPISELPEKSARDLVIEGAQKGLKNIVFSGGESTMRPYIVEIIKLAKELGYESIQVQTNGRNLSKYSLVETFFRIGVTEYSISLHGHNSHLHEKITRVSNSFNETLKGILNIKEIYGDKATIATNTVITNDNLLFLSDIVSLLIYLGVPFIQIAYMHGQGNAEKIYRQITPKMSVARPYIIDSIKQANRLGYFEGYFSIEAFPFCFLDGYEGYYSDLYIPKSFVVSEEDENSLQEFTFNGPRVKSFSCKGCNFYSLCHGPWRDYPEHYGWNEFKPITNRMPEECVPDFFSKI